jgi:anti-anti-sigma regulatory factor
MTITTPQGEHVFEMAGDVTFADIPALRTRLDEALAGGEHDLLLDGRQLTAIDDSALAAFTTARSKAKSQHHRVVALDREGGALNAALRRTGLIFRFPVYPDVATAAAALSADRAGLAAKGRIPTQHEA